MEKITKEELQEKLFDAPLSDDDLEKVSGGAGWDECKSRCFEYNSPSSQAICMANCLSGKW